MLSKFNELVLKICPFKIITMINLIGILKDQQFFDEEFIREYLNENDLDPKMVNKVR